jgi:hypothetical protein
MINRKEVLKDFIVFILFDIDELIYGVQFVSYFDYIDYSFRTSKFLYNYENYDVILNDSIDLNFLRDINFDELPKKLVDVLNSSESYDFVEYINSTFTEGYPDGDNYGGNYKLELIPSQLITKYNEFYKIKVLNPYVYVSFFIQFFEKEEYKINKELSKIVDKINFYENSKELLEFDLENEYLEYKRNEFKIELFKEIDNNTFQLKGFADDNGLYFDSKKSQNEYLVYLNKNLDFKYTYYYKINDDVEKCLKYLSFKYLDYRLFGNDTFNTDNARNSDTIELEFQKFYKKNNQIAEFLKGKKFTDSNIKSIFNTLFNGQFNELNIRSLKLKGVDFFRFYYLTYLFDYYSENHIDLSTEKSYSKLIGFDSQNKPNLNQIVKYYKYTIGENSKDNPFIKINDIKEKINDTLSIDKELLKK